MAYGDSLYKYVDQNNIGQWKLNNDTLQHYLEFTLDDLAFFKESNQFFDSIEGGLVLGKLHKEGGIHLIQQTNDPNIFAYCGEMEGDEYLSKPLKNQKSQEQFAIINQLNTVADTNNRIPYKIPSNCPIINTTETEIAIIFIYFEGHYIINRASTAQFLQKLIEIDQNNQ